MKMGLPVSDSETCMTITLKQMYKNCTEYTTTMSEVKYMPLWN